METDNAVVEAPLVEADLPDEREEAIGNLCNHVKSLLVSNDTSELDALHAVGLSLVNAAAQDMYGPSITKEVAKRLNTYRQKVQFSARFAAAYDEAGLDELRGHKTESGDAYVWSVTHVRFLLRVKDAAERASLAKECATNNWPCRKLELEVQKCIGEEAPIKAAGGNLTASLESIIRMHSAWADFVKIMCEPDTNLRDRVAAGGNLSEKQRSLLSQVMTMFPVFTEQICEMNGYISQIQLP